MVETGAISSAVGVIDRATKLLTLVTRQWSVLTPEFGCPDNESLLGFADDSRKLDSVTHSLSKHLEIGETDRPAEHRDAQAAFRRWRAGLRRWSSLVCINAEIVTNLLRIENADTGGFDDSI